jgi:tetratricopeptide (TPR) repeat protein
MEFAHRAVSKPSLFLLTDNKLKDLNAVENLISFETAVAEIKQACDENPATSRRSPFFFLVGAGISWPSIPLAGAIRHQCEAKARTLGRGKELDANESDGEAYSHWFTAAFPHRVMRQEYLRSLIEQAPITHANFRIADLLIQGRITKIVVTPNFDDLLSRALTLFGANHLICDDPRTVERIDPEHSDIQLIHLHGSYWFYDCRNTNAEVQERSLSRSDTTLTMAALLDKLLASRSPLVIGYSGWANDVFMTALRRRLISPLPYNLYWFCYSREAMNVLPEFLVHPDVYFVVPAENPADAMQNPAPNDAESTGIASSGATRSSLVLSATTVLDKLLNQTGVETPYLTRDPLAFFAERLRKALPPEDIESGPDVYSFRSVLERVERAKKREEEAAKTEQSNDALLENIREAVRRAQYEEAYNLTESIVISQLTLNQMRDFMSIVESATTAMGDKSPWTQSMCDTLIKCYEMERKQGKTPPPKILIDAANRKGNAAYAIREYEKARYSYDIAITNFGESEDPLVQTQLATCRLNKGLSLKVLGRKAEAIVEYENVITRLGNISTDSALNSVVVAMLFKATGLYENKAFVEAKKLFDDAFALAAKINELTEYTKLSLASSTILADTAQKTILGAKAAAEAKALEEAAVATEAKPAAEITLGVESDDRPSEQSGE